MTQNDDGHNPQTLNGVASQTNSPQDPTRHPDPRMPREGVVFDRNNPSSPPTPVRPTLASYRNQMHNPTVNQRREPFNQPPKPPQPLTPAARQSDSMPLSQHSAPTVVSQQPIFSALPRPASPQPAPNYPPPTTASPSQVVGSQPLPPRQQPQNVPAQPPTASLNFIDSEYAARFGTRAPITSSNKKKRKLGRVFRLPKPAAPKRTSRTVGSQLKTSQAKLERVPKSAWITFFGLLGVIASSVVLAFLIFSSPASNEIDKSLPKADQQRQKDLYTLQSALKKYYTDHDAQYPIINRAEINGKDDKLTAELLPIYVKNMPVDQEMPAKYYYYSSLTGKSFVLSATLENGETWTVTESAP